MIAQETGIAFWDMFEAMGGENSMVRFVTAKPALAARGPNEVWSWDISYLARPGRRDCPPSCVGVCSAWRGSWRTDGNTFTVGPSAANGWFELTVNPA